MTDLEDAIAKHKPPDSRQRELRAAAYGFVPDPTYEQARAARARDRQAGQMQLACAA